MIFQKHVSDRLSHYIEEGRDADLIELHLAKCERCRTEYARVRAGIAALDGLSLMAAPSTIWDSIESALDVQPKRRAVAIARLRWAAIAAMAALALACWLFLRPVGWEVDGLTGSPVVGAKHIARKARVAPGEWVETDVRSRARIMIGRIGSVVLAPNTRTRVIAERSKEHRIALERGEIRAQISAPPKLFFVDTASGTAVDLGCEYSLRADKDGSGLMEVSKGWVAFEWNGRESLVPAGASCRMYPHTGPGTPYFDDASDTLKRALAHFDERPNDEELDAILSLSRVRDTLTLWHLLSRAPTADRGRVYDRISALAPVPAGVSKDKVLNLDPATLSLWKDELAWTW